MSGRETRPNRAQRNLQAAIESRERQRSHRASLTEEKARLTEANALMRAKLASSPTICDDSTIGSSSGSSSSAHPDMVELSEAMTGLLGKKDISGKAAVDLVDRALGGGKGKQPVDPKAWKEWSAAQRKAPKDPKSKAKASSASSASKKR